MLRSPQAWLGLLLLGAACAPTAPPAPPPPRPADLAVALAVSSGPGTDAALARLGAPAGLTPREGWRDSTGQGLVALLGFVQLARHEQSPSLALLATPDAEALLGWMRARGRVVSRAGRRALVRRGAARPHDVYARGALALDGQGDGARDAAEDPDLELLARAGLAAALLARDVADAEADWGLELAAAVEARAAGPGVAALRLVAAPAGIVELVGEEGGDLAAALGGLAGRGTPGLEAWLQATVGVVADCASLELALELAGGSLAWTLSLEASSGSSLAERLSPGLLEAPRVLGREASAALDGALPGWVEGVTARVADPGRVQLEGRVPEDRLRGWMASLAP